MPQIIVKPFLGLKTNCPQDSNSLYKAMDGQGMVFATHDTGGQNVDYSREKESCTKAYGRDKWSNSAIT